MLHYISLLRAVQTFGDHVVFLGLFTSFSNNQRQGLCTKHLIDITKLPCMHEGQKWLDLHAAVGFTKICSVLFFATWQTVVLICAFCLKFLCESGNKNWNISTFTWLVGRQSLFMSPCTFIFVRVSACYIQLFSVLIFHFLWTCKVEGYNVMRWDFFFSARFGPRASYGFMTEEQIETLWEQQCDGPVQVNATFISLYTKERKERKTKNNLFIKQHATKINART